MRDVIDVMETALAHVYHEDCSNAAMHCAQVRFSPITFRLAESLSELRPGNPIVVAVLADHGRYEEDKGR